MPFGEDDSSAHPWVNLKLGAQYMCYTDYDGASSNYDGFGRSAANNNVFLRYAWTIF